MITMIDDHAKDKLFDKYRFEQLVKARDKFNTTFHLWMTFFITVIGALFIGFYTVLPDAGQKPSGAVILIAGLGYFVSLIWHLSCKGYYLWVRNWISLVMDCERHLPKQSSIYSCFYNVCDEGSYFNPLKHANISTGKLLGVFSFGITLVWGCIALYGFLPRISEFENIFNVGLVLKILRLFCLLVLVTVVTFFMCHLASVCKHDMSNHKNICPKGNLHLSCANGCCMKFCRTK